MTLKNRVVMPAMHLNFTMGGEINDQFINFYRERAEGGVGLIIIGVCSIDLTGGGPILVGLHDDRFIPGLKQFCKEVRINGVKLAAQLNHAGRYAFSLLTGQQPVSPSPIPSRYNPETPRELTIEEIYEIQNAFVLAAIRVKESGFDAVEILGSTGYLISQFLSPISNKRRDEYNGDLKARARFGIEVIQKIRAAVGPSYPIFMRVAGSDFVSGSHTNIESAQACTYFEEAGVDCLNVTGGWHETRVPQLTMSVPRGAFVYLAAGIKEKVSIPVIACNRINDPYLADRIISSGKADLVGMARPMIADPLLVAKSRNGEADRIRTCIACNQGCFDSVFMGKPIGCMINYRAGREAMTRIVPAAKPKKIVVIGGGPAGCEAARVAAARGHQVILFEASPRLGGNLIRAASTPGRREIASLVRYFENELKALGIKILLNKKATLKSISNEKPDVVIVAAGADPIVPEFAGQAKHPNVYLATDVLDRKEWCYGDTVIIGGGAVGCETALLLAHDDLIDPDTACFLITTGAEPPERIASLLTHCSRRIEICEMLSNYAEDIGRTTRWTVKADLAKFGIKVNTNTEVIDLPKEGVLVRGSDSSEMVIPCDCVVIAVGFKPRTDLANELKSKGFNIEIIGDAKFSRKITEAIAEGFEIGNSI